MKQSKKKQQQQKHQKMPVLVKVSRKQGTDRNADTCCCSSLHGRIRRMKKREEITTQITRTNCYLWGRNTGRAFSNSSCQDIFQHQEKMSWAPFKWTLWLRHACWYLAARERVPKKNPTDPGTRRLAACRLRSTGSKDKRTFGKFSL